MFGLGRAIAGTLLNVADAGNDVHRLALGCCDGPVKPS